MNYQITDIIIENVNTHQNYISRTNMLFSQDGSGCKIQLSDINNQTAVFILRFYGNICEWETDNNNYIIKNISGFELINKNICAAENRTEWLALLD